MTSAEILLYEDISRPLGLITPKQNDIQKVTKKS